MGSSGVESKVDRETEIMEEMCCLEYKICDAQKFLSEVVLTEFETKWMRVATLHQGKGFGELALMSEKNGLRAARIVSIEKSSMGVITRDDYNKCLLKIEKKKRDQLFDFV